MRLLGQFQFFKKCKTNDFALLEVFLRNKPLSLLFFVCLFFVFLVGFNLIGVFVCSKSFRRKKNKQDWNCPDNLIYNTTDLYTPQPTYLVSIYTHLFLLVTICENLFFFMRTLFHLWKFFWELFFSRKNLFFSIRTLF